MYVMLRYITVAVAVLNIFLIRHFLLFLFDICFFFVSLSTTNNFSIPSALIPSKLHFTFHIRLILSIWLLVSFHRVQTTHLYLSIQSVVFFSRPTFFKMCTFLFEFVHSHIFWNITIGELSSSLCLNSQCNTPKQLTNIQTPGCFGKSNT